MRQSFKQTFIGFILLTSILFGNFSTFAQKRGGTNAQTASVQTKSEKSCNSGYIGSVKYTKVVTTASSGRYGSYANMKRTYQLNVPIRDDGRQLGSATADAGGVSGSFTLYGSGTANETENFTTLNVSEKDDFCKLTLAGAKGKTRVHCESKFARQQNATGNAPDTSVYIGLRGDKMSLGISGLPKLNGTSSETSNSHCTGMCGKDEPINHSRSSEVKDWGETSAVTDDSANIKFNPKSFNRLSGTWTKTDNDTPGGSTTETFQWNLSRCAPPLQIDNLAFEQHQVPDANAWHGIDSQSGVTDGNIVKIKATVFNNGGDTAYASVKFTELKSGEALPNGTVSVKVDPGEARDVEYEWDTSGYAWDDFQKQKSEREIKAEIEGDSKTEKIKIFPKPVILVHGLWSNEAAWAEYPSYLKEAHSFAWQGFAVGADPQHGKMNTGDHPGNSGLTNTVFQNAQELAKQIKWTREQTNSWHVDIVAHSMGGLISRQYINTFMLPVFDGKPEVKHLVMLGTPNMGSPCADFVGNIFEFFEQNDMNAMRELRPSVVAEYNKKVTNRKGVKFSILAGFPVPRICQKEVWGDGVVEIQSALYNITDRNFAPRHHLDLTGKEDFKGFVMPRLAIGPRGVQREETAMTEDQLENNFALKTNAAFDADRYGFANYFQKIAYRNQNAETENSEDANLENVTTRQKIELKPKESKEIEISVKEGAAAGVVLVASPAVSAVLTDAGGAKLGESQAGIEAFKEMFRTIAVEKPVTNGVWKLKLENLGNEITTIFVGGFVNSADDISNLIVTAGKPNAAGQVPLTAKWMANNVPVLNAKITGNIAGQNNSIEFFDDGKHADGSGGDGLYGATTEKLEKGDYSVEAKAEANNQTAMAVATFNIGGAAASPAKMAAKPRRKN